MVLMLALRNMRYQRFGMKAREAAFNDLRTAVRAKYAAPVGQSVGGEGHRKVSSDALSTKTEAEMEDEVRQAFARKYLGHRVTTKAYCGLHMVDMYGHVNNAKYLELLEYGRWHHLTMMGVTDFMKKKAGIFVVSELSIQYVREIRPFATVQVTTQWLPISDIPSRSGRSNKSDADGGAAAGAAGSKSDDRSSAASRPPEGKTRDMGSNSGTNNRILMSQAIWSEDGSKLHAAAFVETAFLAPQNYADHLEATYGSGAAAAASSAASKKEKGGKSPARSGRVILDCHRVVADAVGISVCDAEDLLGEARERFLLSMASASQKEIGGTGTPPKPQWLAQMSATNSEWRRSIRNMAKPSTPPKG